MSTRGFEGWTPPVARPAPRGTLAQQLAAIDDHRREAELQAEIEVYLRRQERTGAVLCWTHVRTPRKDRPGLPDLIIGLRAGLVVAIELKRPNGAGKLRPEQEVWLSAWGDRGAVCLSLEEVVARLRAWRVA